MKQLLLASVLMLLSITIFAQTPVDEYRVENASFTFTVNIPVGTKIYNYTTGEYWVANAAIPSGKNITQLLAEAPPKITIMTALSLSTRTQTTIDVKAALTGTTANTNAVVQLGLAEPSVNQNGDGFAGLLGAKDKEKLNSLSETPGSIGTLTSETYAVSSGGASFVQELVALVRTSSSLTVSLNGSILRTTQYSHAPNGTHPTRSDLTVSVPVLANDVVTVSYTY